jgi:aspartokinase
MYRGELMALIVQEYGGTSVGSIEKIRNVAKRVLEDYERGNGMVVVLSAMAGQTDGLIRLARDMCENPDPREMDVLMATAVDSKALSRSWESPASTLSCTLEGNRFSRCSSLESREGCA